MRCTYHPHAEMREEREPTHGYNQCSNVEETHRLVLRCSIWADHARTRRCPHMSVIYLPRSIPNCPKCGRKLSFDAHSQGRSRCGRCEYAHRKRV